MRGGTRAALSQEAGADTTGHVAAPKPLGARGRSWCHGTRGSTGAPSSREAKLDAVGHVVVCEHTSYPS
jgi:hypothetical protein